MIWGCQYYSQKRKIAKGRRYVGGLVPDIGHVETNLKIQDISTFNEDVLMLVIPDNYGQWVPIQIGNFAYR